jgi:subtilisin family serine protease
MKKIGAAAVAALGALAVLPAPATAAPAVRSEVITWVRPGTSMAAVVRAAGASAFSAVIASRGVYLVAAPVAPNAKAQQKATSDTVNALRRDKAVQWAVPASEVEVADERFHAWPAGDPEAAQRADLADQPAWVSQGLAQAHAFATGKGVVVAVLDTGVDPTHELLQGRLLPGYDMVGDDADPDDVANGIDDDHDGHVDRAYGHGTFVAGLIRQIAPAAMILPVRVLDDEGRGSLPAVVEGIRYAIESGADVINLSLGAAGKVDFPPVKAALAAARAAGIQVIAAAGNLGETTPFYPASDKDVISVSALAGDGQDLAVFSNRGPWVDVAAPGTDLVSSAPGNRYVRWGGTSAAAAVVSGQVALLAEHRAHKDVKTLQDVLWKSCRHGLGHTTAHGTIDLVASLSTR